MQESSISLPRRKRRRRRRVDYGSILSIPPSSSHQDRQPQVTTNLTASQAHHHLLSNPFMLHSAYPDPAIRSQSHTKKITVDPIFALDTVNHSFYDAKQVYLYNTSVLVYLYYRYTQKGAHMYNPVHAFLLYYPALLPSRTQLLYRGDTLPLFSIFFLQKEGKEAKGLLGEVVKQREKTGHRQRGVSSYCRYSKEREES